MGNHQKLRIGVKVSAEVYNCQGRISGDKTGEGLGAALTLCGVRNPHVFPASALVLTPIKFLLYLQSFQVQLMIRPVIRP